MANKHYRITVKHDSGKTNISVFAEDQDKAIKQLMESEKCPLRAIVKIKQLPYYVSMTDKFMSGWGEAKGLINKFVIECDTYEQALTIERNADKRNEMVHINITDKKPYFNSNRFLVSSKHYNELGELWKR